MKVLISLVCMAIFHLIFNANGHSQSPQKNVLELAIRCYETPYTVKQGDYDSRPSFILSLRNKGNSAVNLFQEILVGHSGDELHNDITFELLFVTDSDSINILKAIGYERGRPRNLKNKVTIVPENAYYFEFDDLSPIYFTKSGKYLIRFTLLKGYAPEYLNERISTSWISFDVLVPEKEK